MKVNKEEILDQFLQKLSLGKKKGLILNYNLNMR